MKKTNGFTLIEILVTLAVLALGLTALARGIGSCIDTTAELRDRSLALWVAQDALALHRIKKDWPEPGRKTGSRDMGNQSWAWEEKISATKHPAIREIRIAVQVPGEKVFKAELVDFIRKPA